MSKGSGNTRSSSPVKQSEGKSEYEAYQERYEHLLDSIQKNNDWSRDDINEWQNMSKDQKELALMESGFTGLISDDDLDMGALYYADTKKEIMSRLAESISNEATGYGAMPDVNWTIGYGDGSVKVFGDNGNDFDISSVTSRQSWRTQQEKVSSIIKSSKVEFIIETNGYTQPVYWAKRNSGMAYLKRYGGFENWTNGRGEKRRQYIQDDWI